MIEVDLFPLVVEQRLEIDRQQEEIDRQQEEIGQLRSNNVGQQQGTTSVTGKHDCKRDDELVRQQRELNGIKNAMSPAVLYALLDTVVYEEGGQLANDAVSSKA